MKRVVVDMVASSTLVSAFINPEGTTIYARPMLVFTTAGTGTVDVGTSTGGTATSADWIDGGTMAIGVLIPTNHIDAASGSAGGTGQFIPMGGSGSAGDSLTVNTVGATGTYVGFTIIEYFTV